MGGVITGVSSIMYEVRFTGKDVCKYIIRVFLVGRTISYQTVNCLLYRYIHI